MKKWQLYLIIIVILLLIGFIFGYKIAGGIAILGIGAGARLKKEAGKEADKVKDKQKKLQKEADNIEKESNKRADQAEKLENEDYIRQEKAEELNDRLEKTTNKFKNMFRIFLILLLSISVLGISLFGFTDMVIASEESQINVNDKDILTEFNPDKFKRPDTLEEANQIISNLLKHTLEFMDIAYEYKYLYEDEVAAKKEYKGLYEAERNDNKKLQIIIDNQEMLNDKLQEIIEVLINNQKSKLGLYGGIQYNPLEPESSGIQTGVTIDF